MVSTQAAALIASPLEEEHVARLRALAPERLLVLHDPQLLPRPRFPADHTGAPFQRTPDQQGRWQSMLGRATILWDLPAPEDLPHLSRLAWIQTTSTGVGPAVARLGLDRMGVLVTTARGVHAGPLAEWVFMALLAHLRGYDRLRAEQRERRWERHCGEDLAGRTLVLIGAGDLARGCARVAKALDMRVVAVARDPARARPHAMSFDALIATAELHLALGMADVVVMTAPHTRETEGMLDAAAFAAMRQGVMFVNIGRGQTVDHDALIAGLQSGHVAFAALDVTDPEPLPADSPLWAMPNVLICPHSASTVSRENARITEIFCHNLLCWLDGRRTEMRNVLDTALMY
ncbi:MAG TPA: D-2-hydroxyacid dehydrogenase [Acetobacteraceae bacterium]|nr:D-2-hydroxyacid dehydrogenase [Acetobacteraceae bacterium]